MASAVIRIGDSRSLAPRITSARPNALALLALEVLEVADHQDPVARGDPEHGEEPDQRAEDDRRRRTSHAASTPPTSATGSVRNISVASRTLSERRLEQEQDRDRGAESHLQQPVLGRLALGALAEQLDVVAEREA